MSREKIHKRWKQMWLRNDIAFHQLQTNPLLQQFLPQLNTVAGDVVLVPLCGKSLDMLWLAQTGLRVIGIEISPVAVRDYFAARCVTPQQQMQGRFVRWWHQNTEIWCGDIFDLTQKDLHAVVLLYDRAALTALPAKLRNSYVQHFLAVLPRACDILLLTTESPDALVAQSELTIDQEVRTLYQADYHIQLLHGQSCSKIDPEFPLAGLCDLEEKVYLIQNKKQQESS